AGVDYLRANNMPQLRRDLEAARGQVPDQAMHAAVDSVAALERDLTASADLVAILSRFEDIILIYPPAFRNPPRTLTIGDFTLYVEIYETRSWDFINNRIVKASGTGWISFHCGPLFPPLHLGLL